MSLLRSEEAALVRASPEHIALQKPAETTRWKQHEGLRNPLPGGTQELRGYIKAKDKQLLQNRLRRIEGQVRGLQRMVEEEAYCVDILTQIASIVSASEKVALILLEDHVEHCVREAIEDGEQADDKVAELAVAVERFLRV
jgi:DNA-binding FrmR family transcriptional regulator